MIPPSEATKEVRAYVAGPLKQGTSTLAAAVLKEAKKYKPENDQIIMLFWYKRFIRVTILFLIL